MYEDRGRIHMNNNTVRLRSSTSAAYRKAQDFSERRPNSIDQSSRRQLRKRTRSPPVTDEKMYPRHDPTRLIFNRADYPGANDGRNQLSTPIMNQQSLATYQYRSLSRHSTNSV